MEPTIFVNAEVNGIGQVTTTLIAGVVIGFLIFGLLMFLCSKRKKWSTTTTTTTQQQYASANRDRDIYADQGKNNLIDQKLMDIEHVIEQFNDLTMHDGLSYDVDGDGMTTMNFRGDGGVEIEDSSDSDDDVLCHGMTDNGGDSQLLSLFCSIMNVDHKLAEPFLIETDWNIDEAINLYYEFGGDLNKLTKYQIITQMDREWKELELAHKGQKKNDKELLQEGDQQTTARAICGQLDQLSKDMDLFIMHTDQLCHGESDDEKDKKAKRRTRRNKNY